MRGIGTPGRKSSGAVTASTLARWNQHRASLSGAATKTETNSVSLGLSVTMASAHGERFEQVRVRYEQREDA